MAKQYFELVEGKSAKFWTVERRDNQIITTYGRLGTTGATTTKATDSLEAAQSLLKKLVAEKTNKGYRKVAQKNAPTSRGNATASSASTVLAAAPNYKYVRKLRTFGQDYRPRVGDVVNHYDSGQSGQVIRVKGARFTIRDTTGNDVIFDRNEDYCEIEASPTIERVWSDAFANPKPDGVAYADGAVAPSLRATLVAEIDALASNEPVDYHPGSGTKVRDLVHPSLYPYVRGTSKLVGSSKHSVAANTAYDRWGRKYEDSIYQWLPTQFYVDNNGSVALRSYINNLPPNYHTLSEALGALFASALPLLESVLGYVKATRWFVEGDSAIETEAELPEGEPRQRRFAPFRLRDRELQVIPKIVEYQLQPNETHEGVWHVEGMSHEHIIATCVYVLDRDDALTGGALEFKRANTVEEAGLLFWGADQIRPAIAQRLMESGEIPIGHVTTPQGRLFVFPNSHVHKLSLLQNMGATAARRRIIVFWLVDPDVTILSTRDVPPQQATMKHADALRIRLALMEERKRHKGNFNVRAVSLCEH